MKITEPLFYLLNYETSLSYLSPTYDYLKMNRSGPGWSVKVEEQLSGKFTISGKNSKGEQLDGICETIQKCFSML